MSGQSNQINSLKNDSENLKEALSIFPSHFFSCVKPGGKIRSLYSQLKV